MKIQMRLPCRILPVEIGANSDRKSDSGYVSGEGCNQGCAAGV